MANQDKKGFVYIVSNPSMPGLIKVGMTKKVPTERIREPDYTATGIPTPFVVEYYAFFDDMFMAEKAAHQRLSKYHHRKEFFATDVGTAIHAIESIDITFTKLYSKPDDDRHAAEIKEAEEQRRKEEEYKSKLLEKEEAYRAEQQRKVFEQAEEQSKKVEEQKKKEKAIKAPWHGAGVCLLVSFISYMAYLNASSANDKRFYFVHVMFLILAGFCVLWGIIKWVSNFHQETKPEDKTIPHDNFIRNFFLISFIISFLFIYYVSRMNSTNSVTQTPTADTNSTTSPTHETLLKDTSDHIKSTESKAGGNRILIKRAKSQENRGKNIVRENNDEGSGNQEIKQNDVQTNIKTINNLCEWVDGEGHRH
jgi:hypothetical protein